MVIASPLPDIDVTEALPGSWATVSTTVPSKPWRTKKTGGRISSPSAASRLKTAMLLRMDRAPASPLGVSIPMSSTAASVAVPLVRPEGSNTVTRRRRSSSATMPPPATGHAPLSDWNSPGPSPWPPVVRRWSPPALKVRISPDIASATIRLPSASRATDLTALNRNSSGPSTVPMDSAGSSATSAYTASLGTLVTIRIPAESMTSAFGAGAPPDSPHAAKASTAPIRATRRISIILLQGCSMLATKRGQLATRQRTPYPRQVTSPQAPDRKGKPQ